MTEERSLSCATLDALGGVPLAVVHAGQQVVLERRMLTGIKQRAERLARKGGTRVP